MPIRAAFGNTMYMIVFFLTIGRALAALVNSVRDPEYRAITISVFLLLGGGTIFYHNIEDWRLLDSLYFCVSTLTTVGFGDFVPTKPISKVFTIFYLFVGIGLIAAFANQIGSKRSKKHRGPLSRSREGEKKERDE